MYLYAKQNKTFINHESNTPFCRCLTIETFFKAKQTRIHLKNVVSCLQKIFVTVKKLQRIYF